LLKGIAVSTIEEEMLRDVLHRSTEDLFAPQGSAGKALGYCRHHRHKRIRRAVFATGMTSIAVVAAVAAISIPAADSPREASISPPRPTAGQKELYQLASASKKAQEPQARYAVLTERQNGDVKVSVIDRVTGDIWTYQQIPGAPDELPVAVHGSLTSAQFAALPTEPVSLRMTLIKDGLQEVYQSKLQLSYGTYYVRPTVVIPIKAAPVADAMKAASVGAAGNETNLVFSEATDMLWNPLVSPSLRSALYEVLATTPGVVVDPNARDSLGRAAVEISRLDTEAKLLLATYESPSTGAVLQSTFTNLLGSVSTQNLDLGSDVYLSVTWANSVPPNPFRN
jgi:hypothetical protein